MKGKITDLCEPADITCKNCVYFNNNTFRCKNRIPFFTTDLSDSCGQGKWLCRAYCVNCDHVVEETVQLKSYDEAVLNLAEYEIWESYQDCPNSKD